MMIPFRSAGRAAGVAAACAALLLGASLAGLTSTAAQNGDPIAVFASVETEPMPNEGDAADDAAIWIHPSDPSLSTVLGTDKKGGLAVYDLEGRLLQYFEMGRLNNVDLRYNFLLGGDLIDIAVASNRRSDTLAIFRIDPATRQIADISARGIEAEIDVYGLCMYHSAVSGHTYAFVTGEDGEVQQWDLIDDGGGRVDAVQVRAFAVGSQAEGCVADDEQGYFYLAEEDVAIWRFDAEPDGAVEPVAIDRVGKNGRLEDDIEGLTIYYAAGGGGYLIASSQGSDDYVVYSRGETPAYLGRFSIEASDALDGTSDTDGIDVTNAALGAAFPEGVFVAQDGRNTAPNANQNFKFVSWAEIAAGLALDSNTSWDARAVGAGASAATTR
ncbi:MAG: phytase [Anaerolineae bacterium]|nr:phytase [Anaerolineae bacterium]